MSETIGLIGLGRLGLPIARNLLQAGYILHVYNRTASKADVLLEQGAHLAQTPADAVVPGGIVASIVWDDEAAESIITSPGFLERLGPGGIHICMSTIAPETARRLADLHTRHGSIYVEAPIFGRPEAAEAHQLWMPLAGPEGARERVRPILQAMGAQGVFDFGEQIGSAVLVKLVGNFLIISASRSLEESLALAEKKGVDPMAVLEMLTHTLFPAPIYQSYGVRLITKGMPLNISAIPLKDIGLFRQTASLVDAPTPIANGLYSLLGGAEQD